MFKIPAPFAMFERHEDKALRHGSAPLCPTTKPFLSFTQAMTGARVSFVETVEVPLSSVKEKPPKLSERRRWAVRSSVPFLASKQNMLPSSRSISAPMKLQCRAKVHNDSLTIAKRKQNGCPSLAQGKKGVKRGNLCARIMLGEITNVLQEDKCVGRSRATPITTYPQSCIRNQSRAPKERLTRCEFTI